MTTYTVKVTDSGVLERIRAMLDSAQSLEPLHARIGAAILSQVQLGFRAGRAPTGEAWAPLKSRSGQPLRDTGRLRNSIIPKADSEGVTVGTNVSYAAVHQFGATIRPKNKPFLMFKTGDGRFVRTKKVVVPARPFLPIDANGQASLPRSYETAIVNRIKAHFLAEKA